MKKISVLLAAVFLMSVCASLTFAKFVNLFKIERNKNANIVMYDLVLNDDGSINAKNTIDSYWLLNAADGRREEINTFAKKAYGYKVSKNEAGSYILRLQAVKDKDIEIVVIKGVPKAEILINNSKAYLSKVYVSASDALIPKVAYYTLTGIDVKTGKEVSEKIIP